MVNAATMVSDTFSEVFSQLNSNVTQVTNLAGDTISLRSENGNQWIGAYPDTELITDKDKYPIGVLNTPEVDETIIGLRLSNTNLEMDISVYDTRAEHPPKFVEKAVDQLRNNQTLHDEGLYNVEVVDTTQDVLTTQRGDLKIHVYTATVAFGFQVCV